MTDKTWPHVAASSVAALCLALSACGGGGDDPAPPPPSATKLNADNMVDAAGVAGLALQRTAQDTAQLLNTVLSNYLQQTPAGSYACPAGGSLTLARPSALLWNYSANDCNSGSLLVHGGQLQMDASQPSGQGLKLQFTDVSYRDAKQPSAALQNVAGNYNFLVNASTDVYRPSTGSMSFSSQGRADSYSEIYIEAKKSDAKYLHYGVKLQSPRFAHALSVVADDASQTSTVTADDGSTLTLIKQTGGVKLELRKAAGEAALLSRTLSDAELQSALNRALQ